MSKKISYKSSGVDVAAGNEFVKRIRKTLQSTHNKGVIGNIGTFSALFDPNPYKFNDPVIVSASDGVGTKLMIANEMGNHKSIGIDLVAMCVNDILCQGAKPMFFLDYFATGVLNVKKATVIIKSIAEGCKVSGCALIGGETAEMPGLYKGEDYDLAGFTVGMAERKNLLPRKINEGDLLIGLKSSGLHSNGFSLVRAILKSLDLDLKQKSPFSKNLLGNELLLPTRIYVKNIIPVIEKNLISGISHITGGGVIENIIRTIPKDLSVKIDLSKFEPLKIFSWLKKISEISDDEMLNTFNCGIGMVLIVKEEKSKKALKMLTNLGEKPTIIGSVEKTHSPVLQGTLF